MWSLYHTYLFEICFGWLIWVRSRVSLIGQGLGLGLGLAPLGLALGVFPILFVSCTVVRVTHFLGRVVKQNRPPSAYRGNRFSRHLLTRSARCYYIQLYSPRLRLHVLNMLHKVLDRSRHDLYPWCYLLLLLWVTCSSSSSSTVCCRPYTIYLPLL